MLTLISAAIEMLHLKAVKSSSMYITQKHLKVLWLFQNSKMPVHRDFWLHLTECRICCCLKIKNTFLRPSNKSLPPDKGYKNLQDPLSSYNTQCLSRAISLMSMAITRYQGTTSSFRKDKWAPSSFPAMIKKNESKMPNSLTPLNCTSPFW